MRNKALDTQSDDIEVVIFMSLPIGTSALAGVAEGIQRADLKAWAQ